ncbi:Serine/Threonine protein kinase and Signal Transduction Histidine Kinase (STHK) with GAF sensor [Trichormus variabilis ATCC 29413]|uniref:histidine kinase n=2 Tax=Anabaena variabilis TaxID=264691 RepID=Q3M4I5_TRIV2|nr:MULTISPECIES: ATP-binding sensor histidine kinase [Nostocaceae]ABA24101.1 Serine/Threonine protein kinase and Signal Transduction Histidine Kinase (STHK) with GAF sensor [Trichormus variabilis ATCC 29413]MBC1216459.1 AAA family ATPase [Trichormus variabilis ARAD]MBC1255260.1 AAA family ATPase [Trichormus variabilis V5]MBC1268741.1 AAA family ATPase [Trichormus variabilis FSR]MBC1304316.1 AAA family ATPase [Trichormus variabilis N2B]
MSATVDTTVLLSGYQLIEQLYHGSKTLVYRGIRRKESVAQPVVIKLLQRDYPSFSELLQFRNQYTIAKNLNIPGVVRPTSLEPYGNSYALVMEDFGGVSLGTYSQTHSLSLVDVLAIALQLADILHELYQHRVIHKDIKPANILIHPESQQVKLIDFSIASLLPKENEEIKHPNVLEGTLAYIAPEQTGRMNRGVDYRTDFYSLGVTLFELLTGQLPFAGNDPLELVHCHIAKPAPRIDEINSEIPEAIAQIVAKLMSKNAEDRYQSALGLKHDLAICLEQLNQTGQIEQFIIGQRDICDRFTIPEKLYGRETEVQTLLDAFARVSNGTSELLLVAGFSGIGKTAVVNEVHKPIVRQRGYFIKGKFDQYNRNIPFSAFVQAFRDLMGQLLSESDIQLKAWKASILEALGDHAHVIIDVIPELECILGIQPPVAELSGTAAQNRFNLLFQKFTQVFTTKEHPLVMFLDDLQWADSASLKLMQLLMSEREQGYLLLIGAYRDNEVFPGHPLMLTLNEVSKVGATINRITLASLSRTSLNQLVADMLKCAEVLAQPLAGLVYQKTQGNPFFATQFLKTLHQEQFITFNIQAGHWQCDITQIRKAALTDDVVEFMAKQLQKLPDETQNILKLAACIGNQFDLNTLAIVSEQLPQQVASDLWKGLQEGLILPISETYKFFQDNNLNDTNTDGISVTYKFLHDRVQQAAYSLIPQEEKQVVHLTIGRHLLNHTSAEQLEEQIFDIVNQLNIGCTLISDTLEQARLVELNLRAGRKAIATTAYDTATYCLKYACNLLPTDSWQTQYDLALACYSSAAEAAYLNTDLVQMETLAEIVLQQARSLLDAAKVYEIKIDAYTSLGEFSKALTTGLNFLQSFGIEFPTQPNKQDFADFLRQTRQQLAGRSPDELLNLPVMTSPQYQALLRMLVQISGATYLASPALYPLICFQQVQLSVAHGNIPASSFGYVVYGLILCGVVGDIKTGYEFGQLALQLVDKFNNQEYAAKVLYITSKFTVHWVKNAATTLQPLQEAYTLGLKVGALTYAGYSGYTYAFHAYFVGKELTALETECQAYSIGLANIEQQAFLGYLHIVHQTVANLLGKCENPTKLVGTIFDEGVTLANLEKANDKTGLWHFHLCKVTLTYLFECHDQTLDHCQQAKLNAGGGSGMLNVPILYFYRALACFTQLSAHSQTDELWALIADAQEKLQNWAIYAPMNCQHRYDLICAEEQRVLGHPQQAIDFYDRAISLAQENGYIAEQAIANELTAKFYLGWGKEKIAAVYMQEAYYCYARWGAKAKTNHLEHRYPHLLRPILQSVSQPLNVWESLTSTITPDISLHTSHSSLGNSTNINNAIDIASMIKASQSLSATLQLDELLHQLTHIILQNSGGDRCALICPNSEGEWQVVAIATPETTQLCSELLDGNPNLPVKLIQYVKNTQQIVMIDNLKTDLPVTDEYLIRQQPKSLLCLPIISHGQLIGIVSLKNRSTSGVFTSDRIFLLNFLCTQAAISLENARLYQKAQTYAQKLEQSQLQIVQSEKMASLGNLVAGVAHEINNPIGFLNGSISNAQEYVQDLLDYIALYQQYHPKAAAPVKTKAKNIDLEYLCEDLPKLLNSMQGASDRIQSISTSLRTFSRADSEYKVMANLHEGIDSTLLILKYRLKANEYRPAIPVITEYSELPAIKCFPGQLNQVFMNILANAIDMFDEMAKSQSYKEIEAHPQKITIRTTMEANQVIISIADNGKGMSEDVKVRIFDHLFTTKGVGKGTGLGLAIARQIVVEKHGGSLEVQSQLGKGSDFCIQLPLL